VVQLQELLDEWITACWQHRPHEGLRHPVLPKAALTPNETWGAWLCISVRESFRGDCGSRLLSEFVVSVCFDVT
jgi:hypothetical protein